MPIAGVERKWTTVANLPTSRDDLGYAVFSTFAIASICQLVFFWRDDGLFLLRNRNLFAGRRDSLTDRRRDFLYAIAMPKFG